MSIGWKYTALTVSGPTSWSEWFSSTWISSKPASFEPSSLLESSAALVSDAEVEDFASDAELESPPHADREKAMEPASRMPSRAAIFLFFIFSSFACRWVSWKN